MSTEALGGAATGAAAGSSFGPWGAAIGGAIGLAGGLLQNKANKSSARDLMNWQEYMSNTQYQRAVKDLKKAGLNPLLAVPGGASTPSGATYQASNVGEGLLSSALQAKAMQQQITKQDAEIGLLNSQKSNVDADTRLKGKGAIRAEAENFIVEKILMPMLNSAKDAKVPNLIDPKNQKSLPLWGS